MDARTGDGPGEESIYIGAGDDASSFTVSDTTEFRAALRFTARGIGTSFFGTILLVGTAILILALTERTSEALDLLSALLSLSVD